MSFEMKKVLVINYSFKDFIDDNNQIKTFG